MKTIFFILLFLLSCSPKNKSHTPVIETPRASGTSMSNGPSFQDVKPLFQNYCSACHPSRRAPDWTIYSSALPYVESGKLKRVLIDNKSMPPPSSPQASRITNEDRNLIGQWIDNGGLEFHDLSSNNEPKSPLFEKEESVPDFAKSCLGCHDSEGSQVNFLLGTPRISGQTKEYITHQLTFFRNQRRLDPSFQMNYQAALLSDEMIQQLADYFSQVEPKKNPEYPLSAKDIEIINNLDRSMSFDCGVCHLRKEKDFKPLNKIIPDLVGQSQVYITRQLLLYHFRRREHKGMQEFTQNLSYDEIRDLALYFSTYKRD